MKNVNIIGPINPLGYGIASSNIIKSLSKYCNLSLWIIGQPHVSNNEDAAIFKKLIDNAVMFDFSAPCIKIWHQHDMAQFAGRGERIGFPIFELDEFNPMEKHHLSSLDRIFVCSDWAKKIVEAQINISSDKVNVVPLGVDTSLFTIPPSSENNTKTTVFFNCGKWEIRKGHDVIPELFSQAFNTNDDVELWMMNHNPFLSEEDNENWKNMYRSTKLGSKIKFIDRVSSHEQVYNIMSKTDCGLFPSRAEGWNLELLEMLACGKHVITTNYTAHTQFCNTENSLLVDITDTELAYDGQWFHGQCGSWAKIGKQQKDSFIDHMRYVHHRKQNNDLIPNYLGSQTAEKLTWENSALTIIGHLNV